MDSQQQHVLQDIADRNIRFLRLWFTDVSGVLKAVAIDPGELEDAFSEGIGFDGSSIEGLTRIYESDMLLRPDATSYRVLPWRGEAEPVARMFCDVLTPDGEPARSDPRYVLERVLARAAELGFTVMVHPEVEFYLLRPPVTLDHLEPVDNAGYFDNVVRGMSNDFRRRAVQMLEDLGIQVEFSHHEAGPGQNEIDLRAVDALSAADNIMTFRTVVEEVALQENMVATFMPKPFAAYPGSGMHTHMSLFEGEDNAFYDPSGQYQLSPTARHFIAGLLAHAPETCAITNQHVNSYKRLWGGGEAPSYICWGHNNRSALVRVPLYKPEKAISARVEYRAIDASANPYLAFAVLIAAGLDGVQRRTDPPEEAEDNVWHLSDHERRALGITALPESLKAAIDTMRGSDLVADALGEAVFDYVLRNKEDEWRAYSAQITDQEIQRFLKVS